MTPASARRWQGHQDNPGQRWTRASMLCVSLDKQSVPRTGVPSANVWTIHCRRSQSDRGSDHGRQQLGVDNPGWQKRMSVRNSIGLVETAGLGGTAGSVTSAAAAGTPTQSPSARQGETDGLIRLQDHSRLSMVHLNWDVCTLPSIFDFKEKGCFNEKCWAGGMREQ